MPDTNYYTQNHEWVRIDQDGLALVGLAAGALAGLGAVDRVELPEPGRGVVRNEACGALHSGIAKKDILAPLTGTIAEQNEALLAGPALTIAPDGWLFRMRLADASAFAELMSEEDYAQFVNAKP